MSDIFDRARALATDALASRAKGGKGGVMVLTKPSTLPPIYNPATGTATPVSPATYTGSAVRLQYSTRDIDGTRIRTGDVKLLVSPVQAGGASLPTPKPGDGVTFGGISYSVIACQPLDYTGDLVVAFEVQARA